MWEENLDGKMELYPIVIWAGAGKQWWAKKASDPNEKQQQAWPARPKQRHIIFCKVPCRATLVSGAHVRVYLWMLTMPEARCLDALGSISLTAQLTHSSPYHHISGAPKTGMRQPIPLPRPAYQTKAE